MPAPRPRFAAAAEDNVTGSENDAPVPARDGEPAGAPASGSKAPYLAAAGLALVLWLCAAAWAARAGCAEAPETTAPPAARIDLNSADADSLRALPCIGPALSSRIVEDRAANGPFAGPDDLARVRGITPELIERLRPHLAAGRQTRGAGAPGEVRE